MGAFTYPCSGEEEGREFITKMITARNDEGNTGREKGDKKKGK